MKKQLKPKKHARPSGALMLYYDKRIAAALEVIANGGNKSEAIRRAIIDAADRLSQTKEAEQVTP